MSIDSPGKRFRRARMATGKTQAEIAKLADVSKTSISFWEMERYNVFSPRSILKLLKASLTEIQFNSVGRILFFKLTMSIECR